MPDLRVVTRSEPERYTLGVVYEPSTADAHGDWATEATIRKAAFDFARQLAGPRTDLLVEAVKRAAAEPDPGGQLHRDPGISGRAHGQPSMSGCPRCAWMSDTDLTGEELQGPWSDLEMQYQACQEQ